MKVIDLFNKIANGEDLPEKIKYNDKIWRLSSEKTYFIGSDYGYDFWIKHGNDNFIEEIEDFNDEVEIIEENNKIEKFPYDCFADDLNKNEEFFIQNINQLKDKVNEIIDEVNKLKDDRK